MTLLSIENLIYAHLSAIFDLRANYSKLCDTWNEWKFQKFLTEKIEFDDNFSLEQLFLLFIFIFKPIWN